MQVNRRQLVPHVDQNLDVNLVILHGLQHEMNTVVGGEIIGILLEHIHNVRSLRLGQERGSFGILRNVNQQIKVAA